MGGKKMSIKMVNIKKGLFIRFSCNLNNKLSINYYTFAREPCATYVRDEKY